MKTLLLIAAALTGTHAVAQGDWTDPEIGRVGDMLAGAWRTTGTVAQTDGDDTSIAMVVTPVEIEGVENALYVEQSSTDLMVTPYRASVFQLYRYDGKIRLRTYEFRGASPAPALAGIWAAPEYFPDSFSRESLIATLDVQLEKDGEGYAGETPYPYPTGTGGAVEMTSEVHLSKDGFRTIDRGYDANGEIVWGSDMGAAYDWERFEPEVDVQRFGEGVVAITYVPGDESADEIKEGDRATVHYAGYTSDGSLFDASRPKERPFVFQWPGPRMIEGWNLAMEGLNVGERRRIIISPDMGYGDREAAGGRIPPGSWLFFELECMDIEATPQRPTPPGAPRPTTGTGGGG